MRQCAASLRATMNADGSMAADFVRTRELLEHTDRSALNIALDVGFKTPTIS
jgi:hypothetical protein